MIKPIFGILKLNLLSINSLPRNVVLFLALKKAVLKKILVVLNLAIPAGLIEAHAGSAPTAPNAPATAKERAVLPRFSWEYLIASTSFCEKTFAAKPQNNISMEIFT